MYFYDEHIENKLMKHQEKFLKRVDVFDLKRIYI